MVYDIYHPVNRMWIEISHKYFRLFFKWFIEEPDFERLIMFDAGYLFLEDSACARGGYLFRVTIQVSFFHLVIRLFQFL